MDAVNNHTAAHKITLDQKQEILMQFLFMCIK